MEANLKKVVRPHAKNELVHMQCNSNCKGYWVEKKDNHLRSSIFSRTKKRGDPSRYRRNKLSDNYVYRPVKGRPSGQSSGRGENFEASDLTKEFLKLPMGGHSSWSDDEFIESEKETIIYDSTIKDDQESNVSMDILAVELHEHILAFLPFACILRARSVCKMWNEIVLSKKFQECISGGLSTKPWYFMSTSSDESLGFLYDPVLHKWYFFELPFNMKHGSNIASSLGLVCFIDADSWSDLLVCNVITKSYKKLVLPLGQMNFEYRALAFSMHSKSSQYIVAVVRSTGSDIVIDVYSSETLTWNSKKKTLQDWRGGADCVIFNGILYLLVRSTTALAGDQHGLFLYDLTVRSNDRSEDITLAIPFTITCARLMNLQDKLVMVGGIGKHGRPGLITGIGIWVLIGMEWEEVARVPPKLLQGFGELDDVFASSGSGDTVYIHTYGGTAMLVFDMNLREWKWSQKLPINKKLPLQLFTGFCFAPRLDVSAG